MELYLPFVTGGAGAVAAYHFTDGLHFPILSGEIWLENELEKVMSVLASVGWLVMNKNDCNMKCFEYICR